MVVLGMMVALYMFDHLMNGMVNPIFMLACGAVGSAHFAVPLAARYPAPAPQKQARKVEKNLKTFDVLDFDVFSNQKWERLHESHAKDIVVTWPDGHETKGIDDNQDFYKQIGLGK